MGQVDEDAVERLQAIGVEPEAIERALERGDLDSALFESVLLPGMAERTVSAAEIEERGGPTADEMLAIVTAYGLPQPDADQPAFTEEEAQVFLELSELEKFWPPDVAVQVARVYGRLLARIAQTELQLFRVHVAPRLRAEGRDAVQTLADTREAFERLLPLADPLLTGVHRRWLEHELAQEAVTAVEPHGLPGGVEVAFLFVDLKDFTAYADSHGDTAAVLAIERFTDIVTEHRGEDFRFTKGLGDGFMLAYADPCSAVAAGGRIIEATRAFRMPGVHASVHYGISILREGDYFGSAVNLAARLLNAAGRDELVATRPVVDNCGDDFNWQPLGEKRIRGMDELTEVFQLED
jgi:adenylate cyclase